jgi:hypothetical protein
MREIASLTGQEGLLTELSYAVAREPPGHALLEGVPGCGKSWVLRQLSKTWRDLGRPVFTATGDRAASARGLSCFVNALVLCKTDLEFERVRKTGIAKIATAVPMAGSLLSFLVEACLQSSERKQRSQTPHLNASEQEILFQLQHLAGSSELLVVVDDIQYWDIDSLRLLKFILNPILADTYPFLAKARLIVSRTLGPVAKYQELTEEIIANLRSKWRLNYFESKNLPEVMRIFGLKRALSSDQYSLIYAICAGHLELIRRLTEYLSLEPGPAVLWPEFNTPGLDIYALLDRLVTDRLGSLGGEGVATRTLLRAAAVIGSSFSKTEIQCVLKWDARSLREALKSAEELRLIENQNQQLRFVHEDLRECLFRSLGGDAMELHRALAACLSLLRPSDYLSRAEHALFAGDEETSAQLYFAGLLQRKREHLHVPEEQHSRVISMVEAIGNDSIARTILEAQKLFASQQYGAAASLLENTEHNFPAIFCAERDYLLALCLLKSFNSNDSHRAKDLLENWDYLKDSEKDLWCRIHLTLLVAYVHIGNWSDAMKIERKIGAYFDSIAASDPGAEAAVNILRRKSSALHGAEISADRCKKAVVYFGPLADSPVPRNPAQFYMALCNLAGNRIVAGGFTEGIHYATLAVRMTTQEWPDNPPRSEVAINNLVISGVLAETLTPLAAIGVYDRLLKDHAAVADRHLILNNLVVVTALAGQLDEAMLLCTNLEGELVERQKDDSYYQYFVRSNLAGLLHLVGKTAKAKKLWQTLETQVPEIAREDRPYLLQRQKLQADAFKEVSEGDFVGWQNYLQRKHPRVLGDGWRFFGRGFLMSDIQFWSES